MMQGLSICPLKIVTAPKLQSTVLSIRAATAPSSTSTASEHVTFVRDVAGLTEHQPYLPSLLNVLQAKGETLCSPYDSAIRKGLFPLAIPLTTSSNSSSFRSNNFVSNIGHSNDENDHLLSNDRDLVTENKNVLSSDGNSIIALLRWPTPAASMDVPVVAVHKHGVQLLARSMAEYVHRALAEEDVAGGGEDDRIFSAAGDVGRELYRRGDAAIGGKNLDVYVMQKVGKFPDVFERLALNHLAQGDETSALVTGEFYAGRQHFPGFGRPFVFNSELLLKARRKFEAKDAARIGLKSPWWTLGCSYEKVAEMAGWGDEQVEFMRERVTEQGRKEDLLKGKSVGQIALDQAAFLLDLAAVDGSWDEIREQLACLYDEAGMRDVSRFVSAAST